MQKVIQYMKKGFFLGIGMSMGLSIFLIGLFFVKGTDPLTATDGETLTAAKWNALVEKVDTLSASNSDKSYISNWINVTTSPTAPGDGVNDGSSRNLYTIVHNLNSLNITTQVLVKCTDGKIYNADLIEFYASSERYAHGHILQIKNLNEIQLMLPTHPGRNNRTISRLCGATGQYKVIVRAND